MDKTTSFASCQPGGCFDIKRPTVKEIAKAEAKDIVKKDLQEIDKQLHVEKKATSLRDSAEKILDNKLKEIDDKYHVSERIKQMQDNFNERGPFMGK